MTIPSRQPHTPTVFNFSEPEQVAELNEICEQKDFERKFNIGCFIAFGLFGLVVLLIVSYAYFCGYLPGAW
jgi:hypothetical protein